MPPSAPLPCRFTVTAGRLFIEDAGLITTYGIDAEYPGGHCSVPDVSDDRTEVEYLCACIQEGALSPLHLMDVVTDWLNNR